VGLIFCGLAGFTRGFADEFAETFVGGFEVWFAQVEHVPAAIAFLMQAVFELADGDE
jgi:hypothetical protein